MKRSILFFVFIALISTFTFAQITITSVQSGDWTVASTWGTDGVPSSTNCSDTIKISSGHTVNMNEVIVLFSCSNPITVVVEGVLYLEDVVLLLGNILILPNGSQVIIRDGGLLDADNTSSTGPFISTGLSMIYNYKEDGPVVGPQTIDYNGIYPVELLSFTSESYLKEIILNWQTASETNSDYFQVQRSSDGENWESMGNELKSAGNSNTLLDYSIVDRSPILGANYYRLLQVDFDGEFEYFGPIVARMVNTAISTELNLYPNPNGQGELNISIGTGMQEGDLIELYDYSGRLLQYVQVQDGVNTKSINISEYPSGLYFVRYITNGKQYNEKLIIQ